MRNASQARRWRAYATTALCTAAFAPLLLTANIAMAQDADQAQDDDAVDQIIITGSRIARNPNATAPVPVQSVGGDEIRLSGDFDISETLNDIPALMTSSTATNSINGIFSGGIGVGQSVLQLRGLGSERTLVLVDGRRHVAGVSGTQSVDVSTIPSALIERVEVLTGGASAIYGADAVTGVVNFILKDDFEGIRLDANGSIPEAGDGETFSLSGIYGRNFDDDRGNFTIAVDYNNRSEIRAGDRAFSRNNGIADDQPNPARRFQGGDITAAATPNFDRFYSPGTSFASTDAPCNRFGVNFCFGLFNVGLPILTQDAFINLWRQAFPGDPDPAFTQAELDLINRAATAPTRLIAKDPRFSISSPGGFLLPGSIFAEGIDLDSNGTDDCFQSFPGLNGIFDFSPPALGFAGGCWVIEENGNVRPARDGLITGEFNQFGGDGIANTFDEDFLTPDQANVSVNFMANYELTDGVKFFTEMKYDRQRTLSGGPLNTFWDLLTVAPDNPFIDQLPTALADLGRSQGLFITRDPADLGPNIDKTIGETYRVVVGAEGELDNGWKYEISVNYGKSEREVQDRNRVIVDRWFAAIDVVADANGNPICRSDVDNTPPPTTPFGIPTFNPGFFTFNPGDGQCKPANILGGRGAISQEAIDFITTTVINKSELEQTVFSAILTGDTEDYFTLQGGPIGFAIGAEVRGERSDERFDPLVRGVAPVTTPNIGEGEVLSEVFAGVDGQQSSLVFDPGALVKDVRGSFDVIDLFSEISVPLIVDRPFFEELTLDAAFRYSDYSTVGSTLTWKAGGSWTPMNDIRFRGTYSVAVRAPNITELFSPAQGAFFRPVDPCDQQEIDALIAVGDPRGPIRQANCLADGIPMGFTDPLSARFVGEVSGNPELSEETAKTYTAGVVIQPSFIPGLTLSADYWNIRIANAISAPSAQDIVDSCYDSSSLDNQFCDLVRRNSDPTSPQFNGFTFISQQQLNIGALETAGIDITADYVWDWDEFIFNVGLSGTKVRKLDTFFDPIDNTLVDPELGELQRPEWAGNITGSVTFKDLRVNWQTQYLGKQALRSVEIETADIIFGPAGIQGNTFIHDISFTYDVNETIRVYGGINNLADKKPFITEFAFPVSPVGRSFFLGVTGNF